MLHSDEATNYESTLTFASQSIAGVRYTIRRVSLARRNELVRSVRELSAKSEYLDAGNELKDQIEANFLANEIAALYIRWGLIRLDGLRIDGFEATADLLIDSGPEGLAREIAAAVRRQIGLSEEERKN
jgi:hypothetical protein